MPAVPMLWPRRAGRPAAPVLLASVLTAALVGSAVALVAPLALAAPATVAELGESGAGAAAVASGRPVEATALRTERQQVVANPDGTFTVAANLTSASRFVSTSAKGAGTSVSAWPRHSASAALRVVEASALRPAARCSPRAVHERVEAKYVKFARGRREAGIRDCGSRSAGALVVASRRQAGLAARRAQS